MCVWLCIVVEGLCFDVFGIVCGVVLVWLILCFGAWFVWFGSFVFIRVC